MFQKPLFLVRRERLEFRCIPRLSIFIEKKEGNMNDGTNYYSVDRKKWVPLKFVPMFFFLMFWLKGNNIDNDSKNIFIIFIFEINAYYLILLQWFRGCVRRNRIICWKVQKLLYCTKGVIRILFYSMSLEIFVGKEGTTHDGT